ncbi:MAG: hypothetical protein J6O50_17300 [Ruminiclostridium sp.]|nr:hypothetical protein [Ruminiclostridium sp.]
MKQSLIRKISYIACATMLAGAVGATAAYAANENTGDIAGATESTAEEPEEKTDGEPTKDETVYVLAKANGAVNKVIVSDHLENTDLRDQITETSSLTNVENVKGDETFTESAGKRTWKASGNDIYYQGTTTEELPIDIGVTYFLDGRECTAEEIVGKSGKVTIRFDYKNNKYENVEINGEETKIYVPFAAVTGMMLDNAKFRNIEVTNGKAVNDGDRTFIVGTAFPGLTESLDVNTEKVKIPEYFEVTADVTDFEMTNTVTVATNEVFNDIDIDLNDKEKTLTEDVDKLSDAMNKLIDGSGKLHDGLEELLEKSSALTDGVGALRDGAVQLRDGAAQANDGAAQLYTGSAQLTAGLDELSSNNATLTAGSKQVFESLLDMANSQLEAAGVTGYKLTIDNYSATLDKIIASFGGNDSEKFAEEAARKQVTEAVEANRATVEAEVTKAVTAEVTNKVTEAVKAKVLEGVLATQQLTPETYQQGVAAGIIDASAQAKIEAAVEAQMQTDAVKAQLDGALAQQLASDDVKALIAKTTDDKIAELIEQNYNSPEVQAKIREGAKTAQAGVAKLRALREQLDSYNTFYTGLAQYTDGVAQAADGAKQLSTGLGDLSSGTAALADGSGKLFDGISELDSKVPALIDGITQLDDGSEQLSEGCSRFNEEGISKVISIIDGDLGNTIDRLNAVSNVSDNYSTFTGGNGSVKFIYRTDAIEK